MTEATRDRLMTAAMTLFAERGTKGTTVGDIEEAAGLTRRGGAFYKHFPSKQDVLEAGIERQIREVESMRGVLDLLPLGDLRSELTLLCRWLLAELDHERNMVLVIEKEGVQFPALRDLMLGRVIQVGYRLASEVAQRWLKELRGPNLDGDAIASILVGAIVNYRRTQWTFGGAPLDIDEDRFVSSWVQACAEFFEVTAEAKPTTRS